MTILFFSCTFRSWLDQLFTGEEKKEVEMQPAVKVQKCILEAALCLYIQYQNNGDIV